VPAEYGEVLRTLTEMIASGRGFQPNGDVVAGTGAASISFGDFGQVCLCGCCELAGRYSSGEMRAV
jgi:hypothetical protein